MAFAQHVWNQLKSLTADELIAALKRDGYRQDPASAGCNDRLYQSVGKMLTSGAEARAHFRRFTARVKLVPFPSVEGTGVFSSL